MPPPPDAMGNTTNIPSTKQGVTFRESRAVLYMEDATNKSSPANEFIPYNAAVSSTLNTPMSHRNAVKNSMAGALPSFTSFAPIPGSSLSTSAKSGATPGSSIWGNSYKEKYWYCTQCTGPNLVEVSKCLSCKAPKNPENENGSSAAKSSTPLANSGAGTIGPGGFSFGGAPSLAGMVSSSLVLQWSLCKLSSRYS